MEVDFRLSSRPFGRQDIYSGCIVLRVSGSFLQLTDLEYELSCILFLISKL